jgi:ABC-type lipoprotein release transport system permease subunit
MIIAVLICLVATLVPSWWAARMVPADGVRQD